MGAWTLFLLGVFFASTIATHGNETQVFKAVDTTNTTGFSSGNITDSSDFFKLVNNSSETVGMDSHKPVAANVKAPRYYVTFARKHPNGSLIDSDDDPFILFETGESFWNKTKKADFNESKTSNDSMKEINSNSENLNEKGVPVQILFVAAMAVIVIVIVLFIHCNRVFVELHVLEQRVIFLTHLRKSFANQQADPFVFSVAYSKVHEKEDANDNENEASSMDPSMIV